MPILIIINLKGLIMKKLSTDYQENIKSLDSILSVNDNFDILKKTLIIGEDELTLYFIDGFVKDAVMQKMMMHFLSLKSLGERTDRNAQASPFPLPVRLPGAAPAAPVPWDPCSPSGRKPYSGF